jgi:lipopolysaccharide biosynthesis regulator YciM
MIKTHFGVRDESNRPGGIDMMQDIDTDDPKELARVIKELRERFEQLEQTSELTTSWDEMTAMILNETEEDNALDMFKSIADADFPDEESVQELASIFFTAWNLLPHKALGGKSPMEMSAQGTE